MSKIIIPANYTPALNLYDTQRAIGTVKRLFADTLCATLNLYRVSAPLFLEASTGLNDDLNGVERKVTFDIKDSGTEAQVVQSLAKWKRQALKDYDFRVGKGLYCDMNAIRRDEELDNLHSVYVDQWDWEKIIATEVFPANSPSRAVNSSATFWDTPKKWSTQARYCLRPSIG